MFGFKKKEETITYCKVCNYAYRAYPCNYMHEGKVLRIEHLSRFYNLCQACTQIELKKWLDQEMVEKYVRRNYETILAAAKKEHETLENLGVTKINTEEPK